MAYFLFQAKTLIFIALFVLIYLYLGTQSHTEGTAAHVFARWKRKADFLLVPEINCKVDTPFLVILVTSTYDQLDARMAIRETWGKERLIQYRKVVTFFLLGTTTNNTHQTLLAKENKQYGDLIQKNFLDTYRNLTLKTLMGIEWAHQFCSSSSFVMKTDTDMFVNIFYLVELLLKRKSKTSLFTGFIKLHEKPLRGASSKWYISEAEYPDKLFPPFCSGTGYVFSTDLAHKIYNVSLSVPKISLEDVYIGLCLSELNIIPEPLSTKRIFFSEKVTFSVCGFRNIVTSHRIKPYELLLYWKELENSADLECKSGSDDLA
ncbi:beta-1,3-galactosyltransferase 5-like isoform X2 [Protopterus annectens]|nr:beta-1,3-galactosyltransferase 5-like isoform X2 [Protopterus annectens]